MLVQGLFLLQQYFNNEHQKTYVANVLNNLPIEISHRLQTIKVQMKLIEICYDERWFWLQYLFEQLENLHFFFHFPGC